MSVLLLRKNSETPNIHNYDDARMLRYAVYGKSGIIKDYGEEIALSQGGANVLHIGTGEIVHQGWQVSIDASGFDISLDNRDEVEYYTIYVEISLPLVATQTATILALKANSNYPVVSPGDDLTQVTTGTSRLPIAHVYLQPASSTFTITPLLEVIPYRPTRFEQTNVGSQGVPVYIDENGEPKPIASYAGVARIATYASTDTSKGTIEERLTALGFRYPSTDLTFPLKVGGEQIGIVTIVHGDPSSRSESSREGRRAILHLIVQFDSGNTSAIKAFYEGVRAAATEAVGYTYRPWSSYDFYMPVSVEYTVENAMLLYSYSLDVVLPVKVTLGTNGVFYAQVDESYTPKVAIGNTITFRRADQTTKPIYIGYYTYPTVD